MPLMCVRCWFWWSFTNNNKKIILNNHEFSLILSRARTLSLSLSPFIPGRKRKRRNSKLWKRSSESNTIEYVVIWIECSPNMCVQWSRASSIMCARLKSCIWHRQNALWKYRSVYFHQSIYSPGIKWTNAKGQPHFLIASVPLSGSISLLLIFCFNAFAFICWIIQRKCGSSQTYKSLRS